MAGALGISKATVLIAVKGLRRNGSLSTGPRGPGAPEMSSRDAANILLALMWHDQVTTDHLQVPRLREVPLYKTFIDDDATDKPTLPDQFIAAGSDLTLGSVLDEALDFLVATDHQDLMLLRLFRPTSEILLTFRDGKREWKLRFIENNVDISPFVMSFETAIGLGPLRSIADVLRGYRFDERKAEATEMSA